MCKILPVLLGIGNSLRSCVYPSSKVSLKERVEVQLRGRYEPGTQYPAPRKNSKILTRYGPRYWLRHDYSISAADCRSTCFHSPLTIPARICDALTPFLDC